MAFFLIGRGPDDDLRLLSAKPLESRQAAMAELSRLSADPSFEHWDAEVSVMDLDTGVPILLVRPAAAAVIVPEFVDAETGDADAWEADLPVVVEPAPEFTAFEEPVSEAPESPEQAPEVVRDAIEEPFWEPPTVALIEPVRDVAIADAIVAEAVAPAPDEMLAAPISVPELVAIDAELLPLELEPALVPEPELVPWVEPVLTVVGEPCPTPAAEHEPAAPAEENDELRAAIFRTTEHMTAEGIVPPESIGPAVEIEAASIAEAPEPVVAEASAPEVSESIAPDAPAAEAPEPVVLETAPAAEAPGLPETPVAEAEVEPPSTEASGRAFWPWDKSAATAEAESAVAPEVAGVYDALEQPAGGLPEPDVEAVLRRPVASVEDPGADASPELEPAGPQDPMSSLTPDAAPTSIADAAPDESDFILDLDSVESMPAEVTAGDLVSPTPEPTVSAVADDVGSQPEPTEPAPTLSVAPEPIETVLDPAPDVVSPLEDYTCDDCVHTDTCPNRDQRLPKDCGSFQWR